MKTPIQILTAISASLLAFATVSCTSEETETTVVAVEEGTPTSADNYPMTTCVVSGEELGSMGEPVVIEHEGTTVKLCCESCIKKFNADPEKYTAMVKEAE